MHNLIDRRHVARGQALVEFAFVLPVMLLMLVGVVDFARAFKYGLQLHDAAFQGARVAGGLPTDAAVRAAVRLDLPAVVVLADSDIAITPTARTSGSPVTVTVTWQYPPLLPITRVGGKLPFVGNISGFLPGGSPMIGSGSTTVR